MSDTNRALEFLQAVYMDKNLPLLTRVRVAISCLPFECPRLAVVAQVSENDFATLLDKRIERLRQMEQQKLIEATPVKENGGNADARRSTNRCEAQAGNPRSTLEEDLARG
jgi:hypothetical protein